MRQIGTLPSETEARKFADYVLTRDIRTNIEADDSAWVVWVLEEDQVTQAKTELEQFRENPNADKYVNAKAAADALRAREIKKHREVKKKVVRANETWNQSNLQRCPVTITLVVISIAAVIATTSPSDPFNFGSKYDPALVWLSFAPYHPGDLVAEVNARKYAAILHGQVWRLFTPMFLHFTPLHLLFNMMWLWDLGGSVEARRGKWKYLALVLAISGISNTAQAMMSGPAFGGMSGVVFGLFGYVWMQSLYAPESGFYMPRSLVMLMLLYMAACTVGFIGGIANTAHAAGLCVGMIAGYAPKLWKDLTR